MCSCKIIRFYVSSIFSDEVEADPYYYGYKGYYYPGYYYGKGVYKSYYPGYYYGKKGNESYYYGKKWEMKPERYGGKYGYGYKKYWYKG